MNKVIPPKFTKKGFKKTLVPINLYHEIMDEYYMMQFSEIVDNKDFDELWGNHVGGITNLSSNNSFYYKDSISKELYDKCFETLTPIMEEWSGVPLEPTWGYGIRSYTRNSVLKLHRDRYETHILSCIIFVDENANQKWPLDFFDHELNHNQVTFNPGEMLLYESLCAHGRLKPFNGEYYRNMYFHWRPKNWDPIRYKDMRCWFRNESHLRNYYPKDSS